MSSACAGFKRSSEMFLKFLIVLSLMLAASVARAANVEHVTATREGVEVRVAVAPPGATLAYTAQLLPQDAAGAGSDAARQVESLLKQLDALLAKAGASRETLLRINLYA